MHLQREAQGLTDDMEALCNKLSKNQEMINARMENSLNARADRLERRIIDMEYYNAFLDARINIFLLVLLIFVMYNFHRIKPYDFLVSESDDCAIVSCGDTGVV